MTKPKHVEVSQIEFLAAMEKPSIRVVENATVDGVSMRGWTEDDIISVGRKQHEKSAYAHDMVSTLIHEMLHYLRPKASERWVQRRELAWYADDKVRAAAAIRLLNAVLFDVKETV